MSGGAAVVAVNAVVSVTSFLAFAALGCGYEVDAPQGTDGARLAITAGWNDDGDSGVCALMRGTSVTCTGTLISPDAVLTAAHCVDLLPPEEVVFGFDPGRPEERVTVRDVVVHPEYRRATLDHDIAVVKLAYDVSREAFSLPTTVLDEEYIGAQARIIGFGVASAAGATELSKRHGFSRVDGVDHDVFTLSGEPSQPCLGDSGGPALLRVGGQERIFGVHSGGDASCTGGSRETRIDAHLSFIEPHVVVPYGAHGPEAGVRGGCSASRPAGSGTATDARLILAVALFGFAMRRFGMYGTRVARRRRVMKERAGT